jgi:uncharacterized protein YdhG (YjbR/CyaY superfamily)
MIGAVPASPIDGYLENVPPGQRELLERVRAQIRGLGPEAVEVISYGMPGFKLHGKVVVWIAAWKAHCSLYPLTDTFLLEHADDLEGYTITKGSVHFTPTKPLPEAVVEDLVRARIAELETGSS